MGTAVLHAQNCLDLHRKTERHGFMGAVYYGGAKSPPNYEKKPQSHQNRKKAGGSPPQKALNPKGALTFQEKARPLKAGEFHGESVKRSLKNQNKKQFQPKDLSPGHVTILKRGASPESKGHMMDRLGVSPPKSGELFAGSRITRSVSADLKQPVKFAEKWAGPAFANSPSPTCLPLPKFPVKKASDSAAEVDNCATRDLRRMLGLD